MEDILLQKENQNDIQEQNIIEETDTEETNAIELENNSNEDVFSEDFDKGNNSEEEPKSEDEESDEGIKVLGEGALIVHKNILPFFIDKLLRLAGKRINYELFDAVTKEEKKTIVAAYNTLIKHYLKTSPSPVSAAWSTLAAITASQVLLAMESVPGETKSSQRTDVFDDVTNSSKESNYNERVLKVKKRGRPRKNK